MCTRRRDRLRYLEDHGVTGRLRNGIPMYRLHSSDCVYNRNLELGSLPGVAGFRALAYGATGHSQHTSRQLVSGMDEWQDLIEEQRQ